MDKTEIRIDDWHRILFGEAPVVFLWEVLYRSLLMYFLLLILVRLLGKRMSGKLTLTEMAVLVTMGAIIAPSLESPDRGVLLGLTAMLCTLSFQRGTTWLAFHNVTFEHVMQGEPTVLVKDGVLQLAGMAKTRISRQQIYAQLRGQSVYTISAVKRLYLEAHGDFTLYKADGDRPGLSTLPPDDASVRHLQVVAADTVACKSCGNTAEKTQPQAPCTVCNQQAWTEAVS